jgi:hypothetical protein
MAVKILEHYIFPLIDCVFSAAAFDILNAINTGDARSTHFSTLD